MTEISLREYIETKLDQLEKRFCQKISAQEKAVAAALANSKEAISKAEGAMGERLALLNESRKTIADQSATFVPRAEYNVGHRELSAAIAQMKESQARFAGQQSVWIAIGLAAVSLLGVAVDFATRTPVR